MAFTLIFTYGGSISFVIIGLGVACASYQVGKVCILNHVKSTATSWGPVLAVAITSMVVQLLTILYCVHIVLKPIAYERLWLPYRQRHTSSESRHVFSIQLAASRIRKLLLMQWRPIAMVAVVAVYAAFISSVFLRVGTQNDYSDEAVQLWFSCLVSSQGEGGDDDEGCEQFASRVRMNQAGVLAALFMMGVSSSPPLYLYSR